MGGGGNVYTPSVEHVVGGTIHETQPVHSAKFCHFLNMSCSHEKDTRLSSLFRTASDGKLGVAWE